jgi:hypothetical protein
MGFFASEIMSGHHEFADRGGPSEQLPFAFRVDWGPERLRDWLNPSHPGFLWQELEGEVQVGGLCGWTPCRGTLHLEYVPKRRIRYDFDFEVDGVVYRYVGDKKNIRLWNLAVSHTTCFGVLTERETGKLVSTSVSFFHLRHLPMLATLRWRR